MLTPSYLVINTNAFLTKKCFLDFLDEKNNQSRLSYMPSRSRSLDHWFKGYFNKTFEQHHEMIGIIIDHLVVTRNFTVHKIKNIFFLR